MPTQKAASEKVEPVARALGCVQVAVTVVNGSAVTSYPDQLVEVVSVPMSGRV